MSILTGRFRIALYRFAEQHALYGDVCRDERPIIWEELVHQVSFETSKDTPTRLGLRTCLGRNVLTISWAPTVAAMLVALFRRPLVHLCWGIPRRSSSRIWDALRDFRLRLLLRTASIVLVNEDRTREDVKRLTNRESRLVPYLVDTAFYRPDYSAASREYVLVPGNNARDEDLVLKLAALGVRIVRVTFADSLIAFYQSGDPQPDLELKARATYDELRRLYQEAALVLIPLKGADNHPAGQTAILEALACGTRVLISRGRIGDAFHHYPGVFAYDTEDPAEVKRIVLSLLNNTPGEKTQLHEYVKLRHGPSVVARALIDAMSPVLPCNSSDREPSTT